MNNHQQTNILGKGIFTQYQRMTEKGLSYRQMSSNYMILLTFITVIAKIGINFAAHAMYTELELHSPMSVKLQ